MVSLTRDQAQQSASKALNRIASAAMAGDRRRAEGLVRKHLWMHAVRLNAAFRVLGRDASFEEAAELAERINLFRSCESTVTWWRMPKKNTGYRTVCELAPELRAAHLIIADVLQAQFRPGNHLFGIKGRGRDELVRALRATLEQGRSCTIQGDIRGAFTNVDVESLYTLPLPKAVVRHMLDYRNLRLRHDPRREETQVSSSPYGLSPIRGIHRTVSAQANEPRGLLQGSPASNLILAWFLNGLPGALLPGCTPYLYADNVLVAAGTREKCRVIEDTLVRYFAEHRAGPFALDKISHESLNTGIEFLSYTLERDHEGQATIVPCQRKYDDIIVSCCKAAEDAAATGHGRPDSRRIIGMKLGGFSAVTDPEWIHQWVGGMMNEAFNEVIWAQERPCKSPLPDGELHMAH